MEAVADWDHLRTHETYLGFERSEHFASPERPRVQPTPRLRAPGRLHLTHWVLPADWTMEEEATTWLTDKPQNGYDTGTLGS